MKKIDSDDEDKYADHIDMPGQKFETKQRITVRNLRIREDTAKVIVRIFCMRQKKVRQFLSEIYVSMNPKLW